ncbi:MAG TPA: transglycosylase domain-containing protein, partial [Chthoniobacterales bacterium]
MRHFWRIGVFAAAMMTASIAAWLWFRPIPEGLQTPLSGTLTLVDCHDREIAEVASIEARAQIPVELGAMGEWLPRVTVAIEDHRFYRHAGIDGRATLAAFIRNLQSGRVISGGSTITQQLIKLASNRRHRSWLGKLGEAFAAWNLERRWGKERILSEYLNRLNYGNRRLGPEAAARAYFGKSARTMTLAEAIFLAGLPQSPTRFNPWRHADSANRKYGRSVQRLARLGIITPDQQAVLRQSLPVAQRFDPPRHAPHFVDALRAQHPTMTGRVTTTLDLELQASAEQTLRTHLAALNRYDVTQAAIVVLDNASGAVEAMVGSSDYDLAQTNGATRPRSAGSTLKPFVYLAAIDRQVLTAASLLPDTSDAIRGEYRDYDPHNFSRRYLGPVRVREALGCSLNVPAIMALSRIGARSAFYELRKWGFDFPGTLEDYGAGFILGNAEIRLIDLAAAYAGLARGGLAMHARCCKFEQLPLARIASTEATAI